MASSASGLRYAIKPCLKGWSWTVYGADGAPRFGGEGPTKATAAACVIRCLTRGAGSEVAIRRAA